MKIYMPGDHERSIITVPDDTKVERKYLNGSNVLVVNNTHIVEPFTEYGWREFCKRVPEYHEVSEDGEYRIKPLCTTESLIAYAWFRYRYWKDAVSMIASHENEALKLRELIA